LLGFITAIAARADHVLLGTATPIQTTPEYLWDLVRVLHQGKGNFVLVNDFARWHKPGEVLPILSGTQEVTDLANAWELLRSPLPPVNSTADNPVRQLYSAIRQDLGLSARHSEAGRLADLDIGTRQDFELELERRMAYAPFFQHENPFVRHVVLRKRTTLEEAGLLKRVGVDVHPDVNRVKDVHGFNALFEGLNLQTLGALINVDLPWNPTKLEQRIGRIKRFGQVRDSVDMLNLVNEQTVDEKVYERLSERMRDKFNLFGSLPDTIKDDWIEDIETLDEKMDQYIDAQKRATGFDLRYNAHLSPSDKDWRNCSNILSQRDFGTLMREGWEK